MKRVLCSCRCGFFGDRLRTAAVCLRSAGWVLAALTVLIPAGPLRAEQLRYGLQRLGNAVSAEPVSPGAAGSERCVELRHRTGDWSRFNWPRFMPPAGNAELHLQARREGEFPTSFMVRLLRLDGTEWQSPVFDVTADWRPYVLRAGDFSLFRGAEPGTAGEFSFDEATQFQVVPSSAGEGMGVLRLDEIEFVPNGPSYRAEDNELRPVFPPERLAALRLADLVRSWRREQAALAETIRRESHRSEALRELRLNGIAAATPESVRRFLAAREVGIPADPAGPALPAADRLAEEYLTRLAGYRGKPADVLVDLNAPVQAAAATLYSAQPQAAPEQAMGPDGPVLRHRIRFSAEPVRQTVFTSIRLPEVVDIRGRGILLTLSLSPAKLNAEFPFVLRVYTRHADGVESWGDFRPESLPGVDPAVLRFDPASPFRGVRFLPASAERLDLRFENDPGTAADFTVEIRAIGLGWPEPVAALREEVLAAEQASLHAKRLELYAIRDRIAREEASLCADPVVRAAYLGSLLRGVDGLGEIPPAGESVADIGFPGREIRPDRIAMISSGPGPWFELTVACTDPGAVVDAVAAEVSVPGNPVPVRVKGVGREVRLRLPGLPAWSPGSPVRVRVRACALRGDEVVAAADRLVGVRTVRTGPSAVTPTLRHVTGAAIPDLALFLNGNPFFPRMACYHWPDRAATFSRGLLMFAELGVDGFRDYGFSLSAETAEWCDDTGVLRLAGLSPNYRSLAGWEDMPAFDEETALAMRLAGDRAAAASNLVLQVGNEVELSVWGADLAGAFPGAPYQPIESAARIARETLAGTAPIMYVRAGSFRTVPPLPSEDVCGINQYTGRYGGRIDEIDRNLAALASEAVFCNRPLMITEWMGPKYSWASGGIGGVTPRGAAYYLERYWRAMTATPGIVGSSEFTLNWVIAPFEDLTNQTREEAWRNRPPHSAFGGGYTADHVPRVSPADAVRGPCFRSMQAFQSPLYRMVHTPGAVTVAASPSVPSGAVASLVDALNALGKDIRVRVAGAPGEAAAPAGHTVFLMHPADPFAPGARWSATGLFDPLPATPRRQGIPAIRSALHPLAPDFLAASVTGADPDAFDAGLRAFGESAAALVELAEAEGAMSRVLVLADSDLRRYYENYILEFAARGYVFGGDDMRERIEREEFFAADGTRMPDMEDLSAVILDLSRELSDAEWTVLEELVRAGVTLVATRACHDANGRLRALIPADFGPGQSLEQSLTIAEPLRTPIPVADAGSISMPAIRRFSPSDADSPDLSLAAIDAPGARKDVTAPDGQPVIVSRTVGAGRVFLWGGSPGRAARIHYRVTHAGETHSLYDRDTACGLERLSRVLVNCCRSGCPDARMRPRLYLRVLPETTLVRRGSPWRVRVVLTDGDGNPVAGSLHAAFRVLVDGVAVATGGLQPCVAGADGEYTIEVGSPRIGGEGPDFVYADEAPGGVLSQVVLQLKARSPGRVPADGAVAAILD